MLNGRICCILLLRSYIVGGTYCSPHGRPTKNTDIYIDDSDLDTHLPVHLSAHPSVPIRIDATIKQTRYAGMLSTTLTAFILPLLAHCLPTSTYTNTVGASYVCTEANWQGECWTSLPNPNACLSVITPSEALPMDSCGPDPGTQCNLYK